MRARGLIPAHAGKTSAGRSRPGPRGAHPRSRGENSADPKNEAVAPGSSPLTRGKLTNARRSLASMRLIPAHAGKTRRNARSGRVRPAHPRSRGENAVAAGRAAAADGSSPLTRGKLETPGEWQYTTGLIPAHAGKTLAVPLVETIQRAHPRSRGENWSDRL